MSADRLEELRQLILKPDQQRLEQLSDRIESAEQRATDVAEVLPESISESFSRSERFIGALRPPVKQCIAESVRDEPDEFAAALFPVMGPAIRRSISETLRAWTQQFSQVIEHSFSPRGLRWRFEAWRAGVPFGRYVIQKTLVYRVEDVYLIHSASGLLIGHMTQNDEQQKDEDAVSAMFTAIQSFVNDSFSRGTEERLTTAQLGELTLWAVHGPHTTIVAVIRGLAPIEMRARLQAAIEQIERENGKELIEYQGDRQTVRNVEPVLASCLISAIRDDTSKRRPLAAYFVIGLIFIALAAWLIRGIWLDNRARDAAAELAQTPGVVVTEFDRAGRTLTVSGLRDRLASDPAEVIAAAGWTGEVAADFRPFLSLDDDVVYARALNSLEPPASVSLELTDGTLSLSGTASSQWIDSARVNWQRIAGVDRIDLSGLSADAPPVVRIPELDQMAELATRIAEIVITFDVGETVPSTVAQPLIDEAAAIIQSYGEMAERIGASADFVVSGYSDNSGSEATNRVLEARRAESVARALIAAGVAAERLSTRSQMEAGLSELRAPAVLLAPTVAPPPQISE